MKIGAKVKFQFAEHIGFDADRHKLLQIAREATGTYEGKTDSGMALVAFKYSNITVETLPWSVKLIRKKRKVLKKKSKKLKR